MEQRSKDSKRPRTLGHRFIKDAGAQALAGKTVHPDFLRVYIKREEAFTFAMDILRQLEHPRPEADPELEIPCLANWNESQKTILRSNYEHNRIITPFSSSSRGAVPRRWFCSLSA